MGVIRRWLVRAAIAGLVVYGLTIAAVLYMSSANLERYGDGAGLKGTYDAALVLGGGIDGDWVSGFSSRRRVVPAVRLLKQGKVGALIFSGAKPAPLPGPSNGQMMRDYAVSLGADPAKLVVEPNAVSTLQNLRFGFAIAREHGWTRVAVVTDAFHLERARWLAAYFGQPDIGLVAADGLEYDSIGNRVVSIAREALAWWYNLGKVAGWQAMAWAGYSPAERGALIK